MLTRAPHVDANARLLISQCQGHSGQGHQHAHSRTAVRISRTELVLHVQLFTPVRVLHVKKTVLYLLLSTRLLFISQG